MTPTQREAALLLIEGGEPSNRLMPDELEAWADDAAALLRELAADPVVNQSLTTGPQSEPVQAPATVKESLQVGPAQAFYKDADAEPAYAQYARGVKDGFELGQREARIAIEDGAANEPVQEPHGEPVAWLHREQYLLAHAENSAPVNRMLANGWTPLYAAPQQRKPLTDNEISDLVLACEEENGGEACSYHDLARAVERMHGIKETP